MEGVRGLLLHLRQQLCEKEAAVRGAREAGWKWPTNTRLNLTALTENTVVLMTHRFLSSGSLHSHHHCTRKPILQAHTMFQG